MLLHSPSLAVAGGAGAARRIDDEQRRFEEALRSRIPSATRALALPARRQRRLRRPPVARPAATRRPSRRPRGVRAGDVPGARRPRRGHDPRARAARRRHPERRRGDQDRDHRRRRRPDGTRSSIRRATRCRPGIRAARPRSRPQRSSSPAPFRRPARPGATPSKPFDPEQSGHGTHVAGIAAGNRDTLAAGDADQRDRAARVHRELQGAHRPDRRERRARRQRAGDRRRDRGGRHRRHGRHQPLDRRAGDRAVARRRRARARRRRGGRGRPRRRRGERLRRVRARLAVVARELRARDHGRREHVRRRAGASPASPPSGPTPLSLRLKPDVVAPGTSILSSEPDGWAHVSGTSMAAPHVSGRRRAAAPAPSGVDAGPGEGGAQRHRAARSRSAASRRPRLAPAPGWSTSPRPTARSSARRPTAVSFGLVKPGTSRAACGDGSPTRAAASGAWTATIEPDAGRRRHDADRRPARSNVPGTLALELRAGSDAGRDRGRRRASPGWRCPPDPGLGPRRRPAARREAAPILRRPGAYAGDTRGRPARVDTYRYPEVPDGTIVGAACAARSRSSASACAARSRTSASPSPRVRQVYASSPGWSRTATRTA